MQSQPSPSKRLQFNSIRCPLCLAICSHPLIDALVMPILTLLEHVTDLALKQAAVDQLSSERLTHHRLTSLPHLALDKYTFYLCGRCEKPYIAGVNDCFSQYDNFREAHLCTACLITSHGNSVPTSFPIQQLCKSPHDHQDAFVWKCRFCCYPASVICHDHTHLCPKCHERDDAVRKGTALKSPPKRCRGRGCCQSAIPIPEGYSFHNNGPTPNCELLAYCAICQSLPIPEEKNIAIEPPIQTNSTLLGSRSIQDEKSKQHGKEKLKSRMQAKPNYEKRSENMLFNPSGAFDMNGWISPNHIYGVQSPTNSTISISSSSSSSLAGLSSPLLTPENKKRSPTRTNASGIGKLHSPQNVRLWSVETLDVHHFSLNENTNTKFVMSSQDACMAQCVDIANFIPTRYSPAITRIELSFKYGCLSSACDVVSTIQLKAAIYDSRMNEISIFNSQAFEVNTQLDNWKSISQCFTLPRSSKPRFVVLAIRGEQVKANNKALLSYLSVDEKLNEIYVTECSVSVLYRQNHENLFFRNAFSRISHSLVGPIQPIIKMFDISEKEENTRLKKEKHKRNSRQKPASSYNNNNQLHSSTSTGNMAKVSVISDRRIITGSASFSISNTKIISDESLRRISEKDASLLKRGRLSRSFYRSRYCKYF